MSDYLQTTEWTLPQVLFVFLGGIVGAFVATVGVVVAQGPELDIFAFVASFGGQAGGSLAVMWILSASRGSGNFRLDFGLSIEGRHWWGIPAGFGLQFAVILATTPLIRALYPEGAPQQEVASITQDTATVLEGVLIVVMVGIAAPIVEEMLFRGMLLSRLARSMSTGWAVAVQAVVFGGIHLLDPNAVAALPGLMIVGAVLGYAAIRTGNLSLPIMIHAGVNLTAAILLIFGGDLADSLEPVSDVAVVRLMTLLFG